jgi:hypothetical protein
MNLRYMAFVVNKNRVIIAGAAAAWGVLAGAKATAALSGRSRRTPCSSLPF